MGVRIGGADTPIHPARSRPGTAPHAAERPAPFPYTAAAAAIIALGALVRLVLYADRRPLWLDEAMLAVNITSRPAPALLRPLDYNQAAPPLFLLAERLAVVLGGANELALRALPLLAGIALLPLVWHLGRTLLEPRAALLATTLAALSPQLIYYADEVKQYSSDAFVAAALVALALPVLREPQRSRPWWRLALAGAVALAASQSAVFVLAGIVLALGLERAVREPGGPRRRAAWTLALWGAVFAALYFALYRLTAASPRMLQYWGDTFLTPGAPNYGQRVLRAAGAITTGSIFRAIPRDWRAPAAALLLATGVASLAARRRWQVLVLCLAPAAAVVVASALGKYPMASRLMLFLASGVCLTHAAGLCALVARVPQRVRGPAFAALTLALAVGLGAWVSPYVTAPPRPEDSRELFTGVDRRSGREPVYVFITAVPAWTFYTTDWRDPDTARVRRLTARDTALFRYRGRAEVVGTSTGMSTRMANEGPATSRDRPEEGWADGEIVRVRAVSDSSAWLVLTHDLPPQRAALLDAAARSGAVVTDSATRADAAVYRVRWPGAVGDAARRRD